MELPTSNSKTLLSDTLSPTIELCPGNQTLEAARNEHVIVSWLNPEFADSLGFELNITSTFDTNTTTLGWGEQRVEYTARNTYNNRKTLCVFFIDIIGMLVIIVSVRNGYQRFVF